VLASSQHWEATDTYQSKCAMSKGISTQQQQILGAAVAISRIRNGNPVARMPQQHPRFRIPVVTGVWPDISTYIASHLVGGVGLRQKDRCTSQLETTPPALAPRGSLDGAARGRGSRDLHPPARGRGSRDSHPIVQMELN
jgi:hypothetical protein